MTDDPLLGPLKLDPGQSLRRDWLLARIAQRKTSNIDRSFSVSSERERMNGAYVVAASEINIGAGVTITIGANDLVLLANRLTVGTGARVVGFEPSGEPDRSLPGSGAPGITSGNLYVILTGDFQGKLEVELTGSRGENGPRGNPGADVTDLPDIPVINGESHILETDDREFPNFLKRAIALASTERDPERASGIKRNIEKCSSATQCIVLRCDVPPSQATRGRQGGPGRFGRPGGWGGKSGQLVIRSQRSAEALLNSHIAVVGGIGTPIVARGGSLGPTGKGGHGGPPGPAGKADALNICPSPSPEPNPRLQGLTGDENFYTEEHYENGDGRPGQYVEPFKWDLSLRTIFGRPLE